jgi:hypothetical protein
MDVSDQWDLWLAEADSVRVLAPEQYDEDATLARAKTLRDQLVRTFAEYEVRAARADLYQDGTALTHYRFTSKGDSKPFAPTLAWILVSHFGKLATVQGCDDSQLLTRIVREFENFGLRYIPDDYLRGKTYNGKCTALTGLSWANRYFALVPDYSSAPDFD